MQFSRTYVFQLDLTRHQLRAFQRAAGNIRFVHRLLLAFNAHYFAKHRKIVSVPDMMNMVSALQRQYPFLSHTPLSFFKSSVVLLKNELDQALKARKPLPDYRTLARGRQFSCIEGFAVYPDQRALSLPGWGKVKCRTFRPLPALPRTLHFSYKNGKWQVSLLVSYAKHVAPPPQPSFVGIDVGLKEFAVLSDGTVIDNPRFYRQLESKLAAEQKKLSRKQHGSRNWHKQLRRVRRVHAAIYHARLNFLHVLSARIIQRYDVIGIESLRIQEMVKSKQLAKSILDASWGLFLKLLRYKAKEAGKTVLEVGRFYPSSQLCSSCGSKQWMPLHLRTYACQSCGLRIDRDYNAAKNIEQRARTLHQQHS